MMIYSNFKDILEFHGIELTRAETTTLQINVGLACDLACRHCHLEAGPDRREAINAETVEALIACAERFSFTTIDITGGAPELSQHLPCLITNLAPLTPRLIVRSNLTSLMQPAAAALPELYRSHGTVIAASLPAVNAAQTEAQRGSGVWEKCIAMLKRLNQLGYGVAGSDLELNLVANPSGAFLPAGQAQTERKFHQDLMRRYGITFTNLFVFANSPLGRFHTWLEQSGNREGYMRKLTESFNPATVPGLMCRSLISVDWNGFLYDCDFNLAAGLHHGIQRMHISQLIKLPEPGTPVSVGDHCFACTAGSGFT